MKISKPSVLQSFLCEQGMKAKKHSSQNFLIDGNIIKKIINAADVVQGDIILEIGPGPGALTQEMLERGAKVVAVEKDKQLANALYRLQTLDNRLTVLEQDVLDFDIPSYFSSELHSGRKIKVVANLPYHITTPIISKLLPLHHIIYSMTLMVQKEVAHRFTANKGTKDYSSFTIFIQHFGTVKYCFTVEPTCFYPKPSVKSAVVHFVLKEMEQVENQEKFFLMIRTAFLKRRKMLKSSLKELYPTEKVEQSLQELHLNPLARPEELTRENFLSLYKKLVS
jgi:16S rRNA (adenine1518-N6/adenine1519-N6)-dimethyltransferase